MSTFGQDAMAPSKKRIYKNQTAILLWLVDMGHEVDDPDANRQAWGDDGSYFWYVTTTGIEYLQERIVCR